MVTLIVALPNNVDLVFDTDLPAFVRAFFAFHTMSPMGSLALRQAGYEPKLYGKVSGEPVEIVAVFQELDVGVRSGRFPYRRVLRSMVTDLSSTAYENPDVPSS